MHTVDSCLWIENENKYGKSQGRQKTHGGWKITRSKIRETYLSISKRRFLDNWNNVNLGLMKSNGCHASTHILILLLLVGASGLSGQDQDATFLWRYSTGGKIRGRPAVTESGTVYVVSEDRHLYAFDEFTGTPIWRSYLKDRVWGGLSIGIDGTIYASLKKGDLLAINPFGGVAWRYEADGIPVGDPAVGGDGTLYYTLDTGELHAIAHNGIARWSVVLKAQPTTGPAVGRSGDIYVGCVNRQVYAYRPWGEESWNAVLAGNPTEPAIAAGKLLVYGTDYGSLVVISESGRILWDVVFSAPVLAPVSNDENIYAATRDGQVISTTLDGQIRWKADLATHIKSSVALTAGGEFLAISSGNQLLRVRDDGSLSGRWPMTYASDRYVLSSRGSLIFARDDWLVYAYPASRPYPFGWPQKRRDGRHSASASQARYKVLLMDEFKENPEYKVLTSLVDSGNLVSKELALGILRNQVLRNDELSPYADIFLSELASEGTAKITLEGGNIVNDFPQIRGESARLLSHIGDLHAIDLLSELLLYEYDRSVQISIIGALGAILGDRKGRATTAISEVVRRDLRIQASPDPLLAHAALQALQSIYSYHGTMPHESGYDAVLSIYRGAYPMIVREKALEVLRSYRE